MVNYDFEVDDIIREINSSKARRVALQFPEGLKKYAVSVALEIENKTEAKTFIFVDPTYGACDTKDAQLEKLDIDLLLHFGHTRFMD
ncbi:MAG: hypothetical protein B6U97_04835 [Candidatus Altiarchaeales archaeon ex4484_96]|nr:MAG: hypothetical protein B6U97_04835 [Candidatus Altiarchaeales archaeon ex4484_96]